MSLPTPVAPPEVPVESNAAAEARRFRAWVQRIAYAVTVGLERDPEDPVRGVLCDAGLSHRSAELLTPALREYHEREGSVWGWLTVEDASGVGGVGLAHLLQAMPRLAGGAA